MRITIQSPHQTILPIPDTSEFRHHHDGIVMVAKRLVQVHPSQFLSSECHGPLPLTLATVTPAPGRAAAAAAAGINSGLPECSLSNRDSRLLSAQASCSFGASAPTEPTAPKPGHNRDSGPGCSHVAFESQSPRRYSGSGPLECTVLGLATGAPWPSGPGQGAARRAPAGVPGRHGGGPTPWPWIPIRPSRPLSGATVSL